MKITKTVDKNGKITVEMENVPEYPKRTKFRGGWFSTAHPETMKFHFWSAVTDISLGDFSYSCSWIKYLKKTDSVDCISQSILKEYETWFKCYNNFLKRNTESIEVLNKTQVLDKLCSEDRLCYRNKSGQFQTLNI